MTSVELNKAIEENRIPSLLLLHGEESYFLDQAVRRIIEASVPTDARDFNFTQFQGKETRGESVLDTLRTFPVFAPLRLVLIKDAQNVPAAELDVLQSYLSEAVPEAILLLTADKIDSRRKFYQSFKKYGTILEYKKLYDNQIPGFVRDRARDAGRSFTEDAMALFCKRAGVGLSEIATELSKLFTYMGKRDPVDVADVEAIVSDTHVDSVFDLTNAMGQRRGTEALRLLARLLAEGTAPLLILSMMVRHYRQLWMLKELSDQGVPRQELARRVKINPYFLDGLMVQTRQFSGGQLRRAFDLFLETDLALKSSGAHPSALLEQVILEIGFGGKRK